MKEDRTKHILDLLEDEDFVSWVVNPKEESNHFWYHWIQSNEDRSRDVELARKVIRSFKSRGAEPMPDSYYKEVLSSIMHTANISKNKSGTYNLLKGLAVAASISLLMMIGAYLYFGGINKEANDNVVTTLIKEAPLGTKVKTKLPDGTSVMLNSGSSISFPSTFSDSIRRVQLTGEAFFDVKKDEQHPFVILADDMEIQVLGTSFNVNAYMDETKSVAVKSGKVSVKDRFKDQFVVINPLEMVSMVEGKFESHVVYNNDLVFGWCDQILIFQNNSFDESVQEIEKWFGIKVMDENFTHSKDVFTSSFENPSLKEVMESFTHVYGLKYKIEGKSIILK